MKDKNVVCGLVLIALAVLVLFGRDTIFKVVSLSTIILVAVCLYGIYRGIREVNFHKIIIPIAVIAIMFADKLHIEKYTPWPLLLAALLLSFGLTSIFKKDSIVIKINDEEK